MKHIIRCKECGCYESIEASEEGVKMWQQGMLIQRALPELTATQREMFISRICPNCWDRMFKEE